MVPELFLAPVSSCGFMAGKRMTSCTGKPPRSKLNCLNSEDSEWGEGMEETLDLDVLGVSQEHSQPVNSQTAACRWRQTILQRCAECFVKSHGFIITRLPILNAQGRGEGQWLAHRGLAKKEGDSDKTIPIPSVDRQISGVGLWGRSVQCRHCRADEKAGIVGFTEWLRDGNYISKLKWNWTRISFGWAYLALVHKQLETLREIWSRPVPFCQRTHYLRMVYDEGWVNTSFFQEVPYKLQHSYQIIRKECRQKASFAFSKS